MDNFYNGPAFEYECADCDETIVLSDYHDDAIYCPECGDDIS